MKIQLKLIFRWYDFWIGFFWERKRKRLYFFPVPTLGLQIDKLPPNYCMEKWNQDGKPLFICFSGTDEHKFQVSSSKDKKEVVKSAWKFYDRVTKALKENDKK